MFCGGWWIDYVHHHHNTISPKPKRYQKQLDENLAVQVKKAATDGYDAVQLGAGSKKAKRVSQPERGHYDRWLDGNQGPEDGPAKRKLWEFRVTPDALLAPGAWLSFLPSFPSVRCVVSS